MSEINLQVIIAYQGNIAGDAEKKTLPRSIMPLSVMIGRSRRIAPAGLSAKQKHCQLIFKHETG
jgi:hypothetical protein